MKRCKKDLHDFEDKLIRCPFCRKENKKKYAYNNKHKISIMNKNYREVLGNKEKAISRSKEWEKANPRKIKHYRLKRIYGMTIDQYEQMETDQRGLCAICGKPETRKEKNGNLKRLCVDHRHSDGKIRKLLCDRCNRGLGYFLENTIFLRKAADYLEKTR